MGVSDEKLVILLRHIESMSYQEISQYLTIPVGTVKTHLFRQRKHVKELLKRRSLGGVKLNCSFDNNLLQEAHTFGVKYLIGIHSHIVQSATLFMRFIPGTKVASITSRFSAKKAYSLLGGFITESYKIRSKGSLLRNSL